MTSPILKTLTRSPEETEAAGAALANILINEDRSLPRFIAMYGDLGSGKTAFTRGFASVASPSSAVRSPTFTIVNEYRGGDTPVFHFDMYRINGEDDLYSIGFYDYLDRKGICLVEWSENIEFALPDRYLRVELVKDDPAQPDSRRIVVSQIGA